jgi:hypothetical protein
MAKKFERNQATEIATERAQYYYDAAIQSGSSEEEAQSIFDEWVDEFENELMAGNYDPSEYSQNKKFNEYSAWAFSEETKRKIEKARETAKELENAPRQLTAAPYKAEKNVFYGGKNPPALYVEGPWINVGKSDRGRYYVKINGKQRGKIEKIDTFNGVKKRAVFDVGTTTIVVECAPGNPYVCGFLAVYEEKGSRKLKKMSATVDYDNARELLRAFADPFPSLKEVDAQDVLALAVALANDPANQEVCDAIARIKHALKRGSVDGQWRGHLYASRRFRLAGLTPYVGDRHIKVEYVGFGLFEVTIDCAERPSRTAMQHVIAWLHLRGEKFSATAEYVATREYVVQYKTYPPHREELTEKEADQLRMSKNLTVSDFMSMSMKDWPDALKEYTENVAKFGGLSGGVLASCAQQYINAGCPDNADKLIADYVRSLDWRKSRRNQTDPTITFEAMIARNQDDPNLSDMIYGAIMHVLLVSTPNDIRNLVWSSIAYKWLKHIDAV